RLESLGAPEPLLAFYGECRSVTLADVGNGEFVHDPPTLIRDIERGAPRSLSSGRLEIFPFGSNGGGGRYVMEVNYRNSVLLLPEGRVETAVFDDSDLTLDTIAADLEAFLRLLILRVESLLA